MNESDKHISHETKMPSVPANEDQPMTDAPHSGENVAESGGDSFIDFNDQRIRVVCGHAFRLL